MKRCAILSRGTVSEGIVMERLRYKTARPSASREDWDDKDAARHLTVWGNFRRRGRIILLKELKSLGKSAGVITHSVAMSLSAKQGDVKTTRDIMSLMEENNIRPSMLTYTNLMLSYAVNGNVKQVAKTWVFIEESTDLSHNIYTYTIAINAAAVSGNESLAFEIYAELVENELVPNSLTYRALISSCSSREKVLFVLKKLNNEFDIIIYEQLVATFSDLGLENDVKNTMAAVIKECIQPTEKMWSIYLTIIMNDLPTLISVVNNIDIPPNILRYIFRAVELSSSSRADRFLSKISNPSVVSMLSGAVSWRIRPKTKSKANQQNRVETRKQTYAPEKLPALPHLM